MNKPKNSKTPAPSLRATPAPACEPLEERRLLSAAAGYAHGSATFPAGTGAGAAATVGDLAFFTNFIDPANLNANESRISVYDVDNGHWYQDHLSVGRQGVAATSVNGLVIFAGGGVASSHAWGEVYPSSVVDIYNSTTNQWTTGPSLPQPAYFMTATSVGDLAMFDDRGTIEIYDTDTGQWSEHELSHDRTNSALTSAGGMAFFAGGYEDGATSEVSDAVDIYNSQTGQWSTSQLPSYGRANIAATSVNGLAIFAGGQEANANQLSNALDIYNPANNQWTATILPHLASQDTAASAGDLAFITNGARTDVYNSSTGQISIACNLSTYRTQFAAASVGGAAIFAGGTVFPQTGSGQTPSAAIDIYAKSLPADDVTLTGAIAGPHKGIVKVTIANEGLEALDTPFYVNVYASATRNFDSSAVLLGSVRSQSFLDIAGSIRVGVPISIPSTLPPGNFHLLATVNPSSQNQFASTRQTYALAGSSHPNIELARPAPFTAAASDSIDQAWLDNTRGILE